MRKILNVICLTVVCFSSLFVINLLLYSYSPAYKDAIDKKVAKTDNTVIEEEEPDRIIIEILPNDTSKADIQKQEVKKEKEVKTPEQERYEKEALVNQAVESVLGAKRQEEALAAQKAEQTEEEANVVEVGTLEKSEITDTSGDRFIVDRFYYEDCGNGTGYWVIQYSDGTFEVEN